METNQQQYEVQWATRLVKSNHNTTWLGSSLVWVQLIVYTAENGFPCKRWQGKCTCCISKGRLKNRKFTTNIKTHNKSMYCLQPLLAEVQVCCWKGKHALLKSCSASFAKMGQKGTIFNILAVYIYISIYIYCYYVVAYADFLCKRIRQNVCFKAPQ